MSNLDNTQPLPMLHTTDGRDPLEDTQRMPALDMNYRLLEARVTRGTTELVAPKGWVDWANGAAYRWPCSRVYV